MLFRCVCRPVAIYIFNTLVNNDQFAAFLLSLPTVLPQVLVQQLARVY